jgi:iron complex transport system permease protein
MKPAWKATPPTGPTVLARKADSPALWLVALAVLCGLSIAIGGAVGSVPFPLAGTIRAVLAGMGLSAVGAGLGLAPLQPWQADIVLFVRLPRAVLAALAGAGLATAGAVMQALFRNPLAEPGVAGVSSGGALGAVLALYVSGALGMAVATPVLVPAVAFVFALGAASLVYALATRRGVTALPTLLLAGLAVGALASAMTSVVLAISLTRWESARQMLAWMMGDLEGRTWGHVGVVAPAVVLGSLWVVAWARDLDALLLGEDTAAAVGVDVPAMRRQLLMLVSLMTGAIVAVTGVIAFVGLVVPHGLRLLVGPGHRRLLPACALGGGAFLTLADAVTRLEFFAELRLGAMTSLAGAPLFLYLLMRSRTVEPRR